jgi:seryl-tRNA synthetase
VSGTKFYYLKNEALLLELALINWTLSQLLLKGFVPLSTPDLVRSTVIEKCGFQPLWSKYTGFFPLFPFQ